MTHPGRVVALTIFSPGRATAPQRQGQTNQSHLLKSASAHTCWEIDYRSGFHSGGRPRPETTAAAEIAFGASRVRDVSVGQRPREFALDRDKPLN